MIPNFCFKRIIFNNRQKIRFKPETAKNNASENHDNDYHDDDDDGHDYDDTDDKDNDDYGY